MTARVNMINEIITDILSERPKELPRIISVAFQLQPGGYGHGDKFCGTKWPVLRKTAKKYKDISLSECETLLQNPLHEARFVALAILTSKFKKFPDEVCEIFMRNLKFINNWDLTDCFSRYILGEYSILHNDNSLIIELSESDNLWENRISIVSTFAYIKRFQFILTFNLCEKFFNHEHHLIHKACGWMLREISKIEPETVIDFIRENPQMPSIMRSYAMEWIRKKSRQL